MSLIAIAYSDIHKHAFTAFSKTKYERFEISLGVEEYIAIQAKEKGVPVLFLGDMFHDPSELENYILERSILHYRKHFEQRGVNMYAISGNHDMSEKNLRNSKSPTYLTLFDVAFETFNLVDNRKEAISKNVEVYGVPYYHDKEYFFEVVSGLNKVLKNKPKEVTSILMLHADLPNCATPSGFVNPSIEGFPTKLRKLWGNFDLVLSGHIHKPQEVDSNCYMLGSPIHQNEGDIGCEMGYWEIYKDGVKFISLNHIFPTFIRLEPGQEPYTEKDYFITPKVLDESLVEPTKKFSTGLSVDKLVSRYLKHTKVKSPRKKQLLINLLNSAKNGNI